MEDKKYTGQVLHTEFGNRCDYHNIPTIEVNILDEKDEMVTTGYLAPFRTYRMQVSGTAEGSGDLGSSKVMFMCDYVNVTGRGNISNFGNELFRGQAVIAVAKFVQYIERITEAAAIKMPKIQYSRFDDIELPVFEQWLDDSVALCKKRDPYGRSIELASC